MNDNKHSKLKRKIAIYTLIFVLAGAAVRIAYVNITAEKPIIEYYSENEWAGLNGSYIRSWEENTEGYSVKSDHTLKSTFQSMICQEMIRVLPILFRILWK